MLLTEHAAPARVAFVLEGLAFGGCPVNAVNLAGVLRRRGHEVRLVAVDEDVQVSILPLARRAGLIVETLPRQVSLVGRARQIRRFLEAHDLSIVHVFAPWLGRPAVLAAGTGRERAAVVLNWNMRNEFPTTRRTALIVGTGEMRREAVERLGQGVWLLEPPVDLERDRPDADAARAFRSTYGIASDDLLITLVGRVDRVMKLPGILRAVSAVAAVDDARLRLAIVGDGNAMDVVRRHAAEVNEHLGRPAIILTGSLDDPHPAYAATDIGLAMGGSALRALAHRTPVVVLGEGVFSTVFAPGNLKHFTEEGFYGHADPEHQTDQLPEQLRGLLDPTTRATLGAYGRAEVERRHGLEAAADQLEEVYRQALSVRAGRLAHAIDITYLLVRDLLGRARTRIAHR